MQGGGESLDQLYDRCTSVLEKIGRKYQGMLSLIFSILSGCILEANIFILQNCDRGYLGY